MSESSLEMVRATASEALVEALATIDAAGSFAGRAANGEEGEADMEAVESLKAIEAACGRAAASLSTALGEIRSA